MAEILSLKQSLEIGRVNSFELSKSFCISAVRSGNGGLLCMKYCL